MEAPLDARKPGSMGPLGNARVEAELGWISLLPTTTIPCILPTKANFSSSNGRFGVISKVSVELNENLSLYLSLYSDINR